MTTTRRQPRRQARRQLPRQGGFTLVEMMIAIGIIVVLTALTVSASVALSRKSEERRTQSVLDTLDLALSEWELETGRALTWGTENQPFAGARHDLQESTPHVFTVTEVLARIARSERVKPILAQLPPDLVVEVDGGGGTPEWLPLAADPDDPDPNAGVALSQLASWDGGLVVLDAWGTPLRAIHPGRLPIESLDGVNPQTDEDGTIRTEAEDAYGFATNRRLRFVSAGPDRRFGNIDTANLDVHRLLEDNLYSYPVVDPH